MQRHLWHFSKDLIGLAIFDECISHEQKAEMEEIVASFKDKATTVLQVEHINQSQQEAFPLLLSAVDVALLIYQGGQQLTFPELSPETLDRDSCFKCAKKRADVLKVMSDLVEQ